MLRILVAAPFLLLLVLFTLSNTQRVDFQFWPTDYSLANVPLSLAMLVAMGVAFIAGALLLWMSVLAARRRARRAEYQAQLLEAQVKELKAKLAPPPTRVVATPLLPAGR
jgi:putative membrane protein